MRTCKFPMQREPEAPPTDLRPFLALRPSFLDRFPQFSRGPSASRVLRSVLWCVVIATASPALAQVTNTTDDDPPMDGSLRQQIDASTPGSTIDVELGTNTDDDPTESVIELRTALTFDNSVTIDNSDTAFGLTTVRAPDNGSFMEIENGVRVVLRDIGLATNGQNNSDDINLQTATSQLRFELTRGDQTVSADIFGLGSVVKSGASTLTLTGFNTFTGGLTIQSGDVVGDTASFDTSVIDLAPAGVGATARLVFDIRGTDVLDASSPMIRDLSTSGGAARVVKTGTGTLFFSDAVGGTASIDSTIGILVDDGELVVDENFLAGNHSYDISTPGNLIMRYGGIPMALDFAGSLAGSGVVRTEVNDLDLSGDLTGFTGLLEVAEGFFVGSVQIAPTVAPAAALSFDVDLASATTSIAFVDNVGITYSGNITGAGTLIKQGTGTTELTGTGTQAQTTVTAGSLIGNVGNLQGTIGVTTGAVLGFRQSNSGNFNGTISSSGGAINVNKLGAGQLTLTSDQPFSGLLNVQAGGLHFAQGVDLLTAGLTVGTPGGTSSTSLTADFDPTPGADNTVGIGGALEIRSDAQVSVDLDDASGQSTTFAAAGAVDIDPAARLVVFLQPGTYAGSPSFDILTGASVSGDFDIQQDVYFFDLAGAVNGNAYQVTLNPSTNTFAGAASTTNQLAVGTQLDILRTAPPTGDPSIDQIQDTLTISRASDIIDILDTVSPDDLAIPTNTELAAAARSWRSLSNRLALMRNQSIGHHHTRAGRRQKAREDRARRVQAERERRATEREKRTQRPPSVEAAPASPLRPEPKPWVAWLDVSGTIGQVDSSEAKDYEFQRVGPLIGTDTALTRNVRVGFAAGATYTHYEATDGLDSKGDATGVEGLVYGAWIGDPVEILIGARYAHSWVDSDRRGRFQTGSGSIDGDHDGDIYGVYGEVTRGFRAPYDVEFSPLASIAYSHVTWDGFDESGTSPLRMQVDDSDTDSAVTGLGFRITTEREMDDGFVIRPRLKALWNHEWADENREVTGSFASAPATGGGDFTVQGAEMPRDFAEISAGWEIGYNTNANLFIDWDGRFGEDFVENSLSIGVRVAW